MKATMNAAVFNRMIGATKGFVEKDSNAMCRIYQFIKKDSLRAEMEKEG